MLHQGWWQFSAVSFSRTCRLKALGWLGAPFCASWVVLIFSFVCFFLSFSIGPKLRETLERVDQCLDFLFSAFLCAFSVAMPTITFTVISFPPFLCTLKMFSYQKLVRFYSLYKKLPRFHVRLYCQRSVVTQPETCCNRFILVVFVV